MDPVAVVDIGSNSMCLLVATRLRDGQLVAVAKHKHPARLRDAIGADGNLTVDGFERGLAALREFAIVLENWQADQIKARHTVFGPATFRRAAFKRVEFF